MAPPPRPVARRSCGRSSARRWATPTPPSTPASGGRCGARPRGCGGWDRRSARRSGSARGAPLRAPARRPPRLRRTRSGRWEDATIPFPAYAINVVVLPTGKVAFWGRAGVDDAATGHRANVSDAYVWNPAAADPASPSAFTADPGPRDRHRPGRRWRDGRPRADLLLRPVAAAERRGARRGRQPRVPQRRALRLRGAGPHLHLRSVVDGVDRAGPDGARALVPRPGGAARRAHGRARRARRERR